MLLKWEIVSEVFLNLGLKYALWRSQFITILVTRFIQSILIIGLLWSEVMLLFKDFRDLKQEKLYDLV